jgi:hypothetical protein
MILCMNAKTRRVSVTSAARNFADLVNRAYYRNETTILLKNGVAVAHIAPGAPSGVSAREALARWKLVPRLGRENAETMLEDIESGRGAIPALRSPWG